MCGDKSMTEIQTKYHRNTGEGSGLQGRSKLLGKVTFEPVLKFELKIARQVGRGRFVQRHEGVCCFGETRMPNLKYSDYLKL